MATSLLDLNNLNGSNGFVIPGTTRDDRLGTEVDITGDINGDGIEDIVVTSINGGNFDDRPFSYNYSDRRGETYVIFGKSGGFNSTFNLKNLNGNNGFRVAGIGEDDNLGSAISVGDINGDGIDDLAMGAPYAGGRITTYNSEYSVGSGKAYIVFGKRNGFTANVNISSLNGNNGFTLGGIDFQDNLGTAITSAGDINGDGIEDLAVSAANAGQTVTNNNGYSYSDRRGETFVVFGQRNFNSSVNLARLNGGNGFKIKGKDAYNTLGYDLNNAGDINGDGIDDLVVGTPAAGDVSNSPYADGDSDRRGETYVIFGKKNGFSSEFNLNNLNGNNGFTVAGISPEDNLGSAVSNAGDINGDGIDDLILGAEKANQTGEYTAEGGVYVIFGKKSNFQAQIDLTRLNGSNGFSIPGLNLDDNLGNAVSAGDVNGDGIDDLIVGANTAGQTIGSGSGYGYSNRRGETYIVYGKKSSFGAKINLNTLNSADGAKITGVGRDDLFGNAISSGGDINNDGSDDLIVSAPDDNVVGAYTREGEVYVVYGKKTPIINGFGATNQADRLNGTLGGDKISGLRGNDTIDGKRGNDTLSGNEEADLLFGRLGKDLLFGNDDNDTLKGGTDDDTLRGGNGNDLLQGESGADLLMGGEDRDSLNGGTNNDTLYGNNHRDRLNGSFGDDFLYGSNGDDTLFGAQGQDNLFGGSGADIINGNDGADQLYGSNGNDTIFGSTGNDSLNGNRGNDQLNGGGDNDILDGTKFKDNNFGLNEKDTLIGGAGRDIFTLGNDGLVYYDDRATFTKGTNDFARIVDLNVNQDTVKLMGGVDQYSLNIYSGSGGDFDAEIVYNPGSYAIGELIGILEDVPANLNITDPVFNII